MTGRALVISLLGPFALVLAGCAAGPETIVADDEANCRYGAAIALDSSSYQRCRAKLATYHDHALAMNATMVQGYALLRGPEQPSDVAGRCKAQGDPQACPGDDVTGTIPLPAKKP